MEKIWNIINYLVGVTIYDRNDVLVIEDRRPNRNLFLSVLALVASLCFLVVGAVNLWKDTGIGIRLDGYKFAFVGVALVAALVFAIRETFREVYVFDKPHDTYIFTRHSLLNKDVLEGSLSQFRAVQIERRTNEDSETYSKTYTYMVALLMEGLLLGQSDTQILREQPPLFNSKAAENRIAAAIAKFLNIERQGVVDVL